MERYLMLATRTPGFRDAAFDPVLEFPEAPRQAGPLEAKGGVSDTTGGAYVLQSNSLAEAQAAAGTDRLATTGSSLLSVPECSTR